MTKARKHWIDSAIGFFSPEAEYRRTHFRRATAILRKYEAASSGRRTAGWKGLGGTSANAEIGPALHRVRDRVREQVRNNPYAGSAVSEIESSVVGTGILSTAEVSGGGRLQDRFRGLWRDWCDSTDCDVDGVNNLYGLQALMQRTVAESGECLVVRRFRKKTDGYKLSVPLQIQVLEGDFIDTSKEASLENGGMIVQGVEFDSKGRRVAYWLWNQHPGDRTFLNGKSGILSERVDAKDILHLYRVDRAGQVRGISWGAPCVVRLHDLDTYEDAQLLRQRIAASFAGYVRDMEMPDGSAQAEQAFPSSIEAGAIEILPPGKTIEFPNLPQVSNDGHTERVLRSIAVGWGVTYEGISGDWSRVNYSSARMAMIKFKRNVTKWQWQLFIPRACIPIFHWFVEACDVGLGLPVSSSDTRAIWTPPRFELIDPTKEIPAIITGIRGGLQSLPEAMREQGFDPETQLAEIKAFNDKLDKLGIILDSDPRRVMQSGILQQPTAAELTPEAASSGKDSGK